MNIFIADTLKDLRKNRGNTQEELAVHVGVSDQAVSKWERGESFPDITLLPAIAFYYDVSVDDLLGVGRSKIEKKISEYLDKSKAFQEIGDAEGNLKLWTEAKKEFPNSYDVLYNYMTALPSERSEEIVKTANQIYNVADVSKPSYDMIWDLIHVFTRVGNDEKAIEYALKLPRAEVSRDHMLSKIYKGSKLVGCVQDNLPELVQLIDDQISRIVWHGDLSRDEQRKTRQYGLKIYRWLYENGDYGYYFTKVANIYADLAILDAVDENFKATDRNIDSVIENLSQMADHEIQFVTQRGYRHTSLLVNRTFHEDGFQGYSNSTENACRWAINFMYRDWFVLCREDERFKEIEERLAVHAN